MLGGNLGSLLYVDVSLMPPRYDNTPMKYTTIFHGCKTGNLLMKKKLNIFLIFALNIDRGFTLEPSH